MRDCYTVYTALDELVMVIAQCLQRVGIVFIFLKARKGVLIKLVLKHN